ncbi:folate-binding protein [Dyella terrae]|uniref:Folate-binding protein n=3 Tax=Dyella TaxID=231454 RepID=A0A4R0Z3N0_9GAMM|nr:folate-binding protein [Dyella terrae]TCI13866.1 folate-binding protein [Dyella soli]
MHPHLAAETLTLEGPDAIAFAQSQLSSNVADLAVGQWQFSAWLDPQGRVRALLQLARTGEHQLVALLRGGSASTLVEGLRRFVFRSKVIIQSQARQSIATGEPMDAHVAHNHKELVLGCGDHSMVIGDISADDTWRVRQVQLGWPWLPDASLAQHLPQSLSLERLHAVALDKGCYPGQEIVARLHYRGGNKRHLHCVVMSQHVDAGSDLRGDDRELAHVLDVIAVDGQYVALAVMPDNIINANDDTFLSDAGVKITTTHQWPA